MLSIYLCEDNLTLLRQIEQCIRKYLLCRDSDIELACTSASLDEFQKGIAAKPSGGIGFYFLDADLNSAGDIFRTAVNIRLKDPLGFFVFLSGDKDCCSEILHHHIEALGCISKNEPDIMEAQICECIDIAYERYLAITSDSEKYYLGGFGTRKYYLPLKDIIYFTTSSLPHQLIVRLTYGMYTIRGDIKNVEKKLDKRFHRCAKSYLVNTYYIRCIDKSARHLILKDGTQILMSQRGLRQLQDSLPEFVG